MYALFDDIAVIHHEDAVGVLDRRQTMRDDKRGLSAHQLPHRRLHLLLGLGVDVARGLVENEHRRVAQHRAGDGEQPLLPLADVAAVLRDHGVVPGGETEDGIVDARGLGGAHNVVHRRALAAVGDVFKHRALEHPRLLQHHGVTAAQRVARHAADLAAVHEDMPGIHIIEAHQQVDERRLARAGVADDGDDLAGVCGEGQIVQNGFSGQVSETHVLSLHAAGHMLQNGGAGRVRALLGFVQQREHALGGGKGGVDLIENVGDLVDRGGEFPGVEDEG